MMRICLVRYDMTEKSGADRVAAILANELSAHFKVHLLSICGAGEEPFYALDARVVYEAALQGHERLRKTLLPGASAIRKYVKKHRIDILVAVGGIAIPYVELGGLGTGVKKVFCEHLNLALLYSGRTDRLFRTCAARRFDKIITLTRRDAENYRQTFGLEENKVDHIYNWAADEVLSRKSVYDPTSRKIITVGRLEEIKGFDLLIKAAKTVFARHPDWRWDIYGGGPQEGDIRRWIQENGLENHVFLMGVTDKIYEVYPQYAFYVMSSRGEGLPLVLLEAKAGGLPLVSFDCMTGPSEIIEDGISGYLVPPEDADALAERVCQLMEDRDLRCSLAEHARDNVHLFDKKTIVAKWVRLMKELAP